MQDTFPPNLPSSQQELRGYRSFLSGPVANGVYRSLLFPLGSPVTPFLNPKDFDVSKAEGALGEFEYIPNTRFGMPLTELNRKRIFRKIQESPGYRERRKEYLAELLDCGISKVAREDRDRVRKLVVAENRERLVRLGVDPNDPRQRINDMQELKFIPALAQIDWLAQETGVGREDWSMALEKDSFAFFDGVLSGIHSGRSYYVKEDFILEMLKDLAADEQAYEPFFRTYNTYEQFGYPFGNRLYIGQARKSCRLLKADIRRRKAGKG